MNNINIKYIIFNTENGMWVTGKVEQLFTDDIKEARRFDDYNKACKGCTVNEYAVKVDN